MNNEQGTMNFQIQIPTRYFFTYYRLPVTDYRLPVTDYRSPVTDYRLPVTFHCTLLLPTFSLRPPPLSREQENLPGGLTFMRT
jgi:hypothetical protein